MENHSDSIIQVKNLSYQVQQKPLLTDVSFSVVKGESVAIVGANGAGKTTLIRCLLGLLESEKSTISLNQRNLVEFTRSDIAKQISYVPQQLPENIAFTVIEFLMMSRYAHSGGSFQHDTEGEKIALGIIKQLEIEHLSAQSVASLSGGERQKVNIAAALTQQAPIIILDEPTSQLDPKQRESIQRLLRNISENKTIIAITHDLNWAATQFDRVIGMKDGEIVSDLHSADFMTEENLELIFDTSWNVFPHPQSGKNVILPH